jgi:hypothetical protein
VRVGRHDEWPGMGDASALTPFEVASTGLNLVRCLRDEKQSPATAGCEW